MSKLKFIFSIILLYYEFVVRSLFFNRGSYINCCDHGKLFSSCNIDLRMFLIFLTVTNDHLIYSDKRNF